MAKEENALALEKVRFKMHFLWQLRLLVLIEIND